MVARGQAGLGGGDPCAGKSVVEPGEHLAGANRGALVDQDLVNPALGLERQLDRIVHRFDPTGRDEHARPRHRGLGAARRGPAIEP